MAYAAGNIVDFIGGFGQRRKAAQIDEAMKNYLANPDQAVQDVNAVSGQAGIAMHDRQIADQTATRAAQLEQQKQKLAAVRNMGTMLSGVAKTNPQNLGAAFDRLTPVFKNGLGMGDDEIAQWKANIAQDPTVLDSLVADADAKLKSASPGDWVYDGTGAVRFKVPQAAPKPQLIKATDENGNEVIVQVGGGAGNQTGDVAPPSPTDVAPTSGGLVPLTGEEIETAVLGAVPGMTVTGRGRTAGRNAAVGGVSNSYHLTDQARDFVPEDGVAAIPAAAAQLRQQLGGDYDVIAENDHIHVEPSPSHGARTTGDNVVYRGGAKPNSATSQRRSLSADEVAAAGYAPGTVVQRNELTGEDSVKQGPPKTTTGKNTPEAVRIRAQDAYNAFDQLEKAAIALRDHPARSRSTGPLQGRLPSFSDSASDFDNKVQALKDKVAVSTLAAMKALSATGASGFGNLSNKDAARLENQFGNLSETSEKSFSETINQIIADAQDKKKSIQQGLEGSASTGAPAVGTLARNPKTGAQVRFNGKGWVPVK